MKTRLVIGLSLGLLVLAAALAEAGVRVPLEKVPAPAVKAIKERFPKAEIRFVDKEGGDRYEFGMKEGDRLFDAGVTAEGKLLGTKEDVAVEKIPAVVKDAVKKKFPDAKIEEAEKITTGEKDK